MDEEKEKQKVEETKEDKGEAEAPEDAGSKQKTPQSIIDANTAAERLEKATEKHKEQLDRQEDMIARKILGGGSEGGQKAPEETKDEKKKREAAEFFKGTSLEKAIKPDEKK